MAASRNRQDNVMTGALPASRRPVVILRPIHDEESEAEGDGSSPARELQDAVARFVAERGEQAERSERWPQRQRLVFMVGSAIAMWGITIAGIAVATNLLG